MSLTEGAEPQSAGAGEQHVRPLCPTGVLESLGEFNPAKDSISSYLERMQLYFEANAVGDQRKVAVLLTVIGAKTYETLKSLLAPALPREKLFEELVQELQKHFDPQPLVIAERFRFYQRSQKADESVAEFIANLRRLSIKCKFGEFLDQALRDRFVCGVKTEAIQKKLLTEADLTMKRAQEIAQGMESVDKSAKDLKGDVTPRVTESVNLAAPMRTHEKAKPCYCCGRRHDPKLCKFKDAKCHRCGKQGHIVPACKTTSPPPADRRRRAGHKSYQRRKTGSTKWVEVDEDDNDALPLFVLQGEVLLFRCPWHLGGLLSSLNWILEQSSQKFSQLFPGQSLRQSPVELKTYTGERLEIVGEIDVEVSYQDQESKTLPLVVVRGEGPPLLGRNWLKHFTLDWGRIKKILQEKDALDKLLVEYADVFSDTLGKITSVKAKVAVSPTAVPKFHCPRPVPYALKPLVEQELERLEKAGILKRMDHGDWAAPIVTVPKRDGQVRICGDYKVTVNPVLEVDQYPLPHPEDLFATLVGGKYFSTVDLSHACNQIALDDDLQELFAINTHHGLFHYTRLPFGVAKAPAMFQKTMDIILQGMDGVICYIACHGQDGS